MEIHELVKRVTSMSSDDRLNKEEQEVLFAAAVGLATYRKAVDDLQDRVKRLYDEMTKERESRNEQSSN